MSKSSTLRRYLVILSSLSVFLTPLTHARDSYTTLNGVINKIVDGDTVHVRVVSNRKFSHWASFLEDPSRPPSNEPVELKIRMIGMDTPESHVVTDHGVVGQGQWGERAAQELESYLPLGTKVKVADFGLDKYGRTLGQIFKNGEDINRKMVLSGWAAPYIICEGKGCTEEFVHGAQVRTYLAACKDAESRGLGIYDKKNPLQELPFVFRLRVMHRTPDKFVGDYQTEEFYRPAEYDRVDVCERIFFMRSGDAVRLGYRAVR